MPRFPFSPALVIACALAGFGLAACGSLSGRTPLPYTDSFDTPSDRWAIGAESSGEMDCQNGEFTIRVDEPNTDLWSVLPVAQADVVIEVDARTVFGSLRNDYGVMCRYAGGTFYYFAISADGYAAIMLVDANADAGQTFTVLAPESQMMAPSEAIHTGYGTTNHIRAECLGDRLALEVNGEPVLSVTDDSLTAPGDVGLVAGTFERGGVRVNFDDFSVAPGDEPSDEDEQ
jgi:hypothetical protein